MAWIESHDTLPRHPKTRRLARLLGVPVPQALGHLHLLWWWTLGFGHNGTLDGYSAEDAADELMWDGDPNALVQSLLAVGFLDGPPEGPWHVHDWTDYAGRLEAKRADDRARAKAHREQRRASAAGNPVAAADRPDRPPTRAEDEQPTVREPSAERTQTVREPSAERTKKSDVTVPYRTMDPDQQHQHGRARDPAVARRLESAWFQYMGGPISPVALEDLRDYLSPDPGRQVPAVTCDVIELALQAAHDNGVRKLVYVKRVLDGAIARGITDRATWEASEGQRQQARATTRASPGASEPKPSRTAAAYLAEDDPAGRRDWG